MGAKGRKRKARRKAAHRTGLIRYLTGKNDTYRIDRKTPHPDPKMQALIKEVFD